MRRNLIGCFSVCLGSVFQRRHCIRSFTVDTTSARVLFSPPLDVSQAPRTKPSPRRALQRDGIARFCVRTGRRIG